MKYRINLRLCNTENPSQNPSQSDSSKRRLLKQVALIDLGLMLVAEYAFDFKHIKLIIEAVTDLYR